MNGADWFAWLEPKIGGDQIKMQTIGYHNAEQKSYKAGDTFPFKWVNKKWRDGFYVTSMAFTGNKWVVVMSHDTGFSQQVVELDFLYPCDSIVNLTWMQTIFLRGEQTIRSHTSSMHSLGAL